MAPFYAYARSISDGTNGIVWRYLMTFSSREDADEWWRIISQPTSPTAGIFQRINPQYYTFLQLNVPDFILGKTFVGGKTFQNNMFFTLLNDRDGRIQSTFPQQEITDHISGKWFYIRSRSDPDRFWYCNVGTGAACLVCGLSWCGNVHVSTERRSRFYIKAPSAPQDSSQNTIMIRADQITIAPDNEYILQITDNNELKAVKTSVTQDIVFGDIRGRFAVTAKRLSDGVVVEYVVPVDRGTGEVWELAA